MRSDGVRPLDPQERGALAALTRKHALRAGLGIGAVPAFVLYALVVGAILGHERFAAWVCPVGLVGVPAALLWASESLLAWRALRRERGEPQVERFVGAPNPNVIRDPTMRRLVRDGLVVPYRVTELEVLVASSMPWTSRGRAIATSTPLRIVEVGNAVDPYDEHGSRALSEAERAELRRHAAREGRLPMLAYGLGGIGLAWAALIVLGGAHHAVAQGWQPLAALVLGSLAGVLALYVKRREARLRGVAESGRVKRIAGDVEVLEPSGLVWTLAGEPAVYRTH